MKLCAAIAALCTSLATTAPAQGQALPATPDTPVQTASEVRAAGGTVPNIDIAAPATNKQKYFKLGIQGEVHITGTVDTDGILRNISITRSSRSNDLDEFARDLMSRSKFSPAKDKAGQPVPAKVTFPLFFWKDSITDGSIFTKRCDDFVVDADWHAKAFPEEKPEKLRSWLMLSGAIFARQYSSKSKITTDPTFQRVYDICRAKPSYRFAHVFVKESR